MRRPPRICALITARNEAAYLRFLLPYLWREGVDVVLIDHQSADDTPRLVAEFRPRPVVASLTLPYEGFFSLGQQLAAKRAALESLDHDWVVHQDADEILAHRDPGKGLRAAIEEAEAAGANAVNFEEFCFIPEPGVDYRGRDYPAEMRRYYFFAPGACRLNRAWRRTAGFDNRFSMGHRLRGDDLRLHGQYHDLRHYIVLSQAHAWAKYLHRRFDPAEIAQGFHGNRLHLSREDLRLPVTAPWLHTLGSADSLQALARDRPVAKHFWHWPKAEEGLVADPV